MKTLKTIYTCFALSSILVILTMPSSFGAEEHPRQGPPDLLVYASQLSSLGEQELNAGRPELAVEYYRRSIEAVRRYRSSSQRDRDTAAAFLAEVEHRHEHARSVVKARKKARGESSIGAKVARTITIVAVLGGTGYLVYNYSQKKKQTNATWPPYYR